jgi:Ca-activated chloride channel family protein
MKSVVLVLLFLLSSATDEARKANEAYDRGDFATAEKGYREALLVSPDDARLYFNLGNALTRQGKFDEARSAFEQFKSMSTDPSDRAAADYNIGNIHGLQEQWAEAAQRYRDALRGAPDDAQAQYNYELAQRRMTEPPQNPESQQGDDKNEEQDENEQNDQNQDPNDEQQNDQQQGNENQQDQNEQGQQQQEGEMSQKEAEQILNALENKEKELLKEYQKKQIPPRTRHAKDW